MANSAPTCQTRPGSAPDESLARVVQDRCDVGQEPESEVAVDQAVVVREAELGDPAGLDLALDDPRHLTDRTEAQDRGLARVQDRRSGVDTRRPRRW